MRIISILLAAVFFIAPAIAIADENILQNASFDNEEHMQYWASDGNAVFIWTETWHPREGSWSFGVGNDLDWAKSNKWGRCLQVLRDTDNPNEIYSVSEGEVINFSMYVMAEEGYEGKASLKLEFFGYDRREGFSGEPLASYQSKIYKSNPEWKWTKLTVRGSAPEGTVSVAVSGISDNMSKGSKYIWFDDGYAASVIPQ